MSKLSVKSVSLTLLHKKAMQNIVAISVKADCTACMQTVWTIFQYYILCSMNIFGKCMTTKQVELTSFNMYSRVGIMGLDPYQVVFKICWSRLEHCLTLMHRVLVWLMIRFNCMCIIENACAQVHLSCIVLSQAFLSFVKSQHYIFAILLMIINNKFLQLGLNPIPHESTLKSTTFGHSRHS